MQNDFFNQNSGYYQPPTLRNMPHGQMAQMVYFQEKRKKEKNEIISAGIIIGSAIILLLIAEVVIASSLQMFNLKGLYDSSALMQNCFNMIAVHFPMLIIFGIMALILKKRFVSPVVPTKKIGFSTGAQWICVGMGACVGASVLTNLIIKLVENFGYELTQPELLEIDSPLTCLVIVFSTAIVPAIIEEFSMRCCALGALRKHGKGFAVFAVSVVFGLLHGNVIQFIFAFMLGLVFGYITIKTESVLPAMLIHGFNNGISVVNDIVKYLSNKDTADHIVTAVYTVWLVLAVISFAILLLKRDLLMPREPKKPREPYALNFFEKCACLLPGLAIPFALLILLTTQYIHKI